MRKLVRVLLTALAVGTVGPVSAVRAAEEPLEELAGITADTPEARKLVARYAGSIARGKNAAKAQAVTVCGKRKRRALEDLLGDNSLGIQPSHSASEW